MRKYDFEISLPGPSITESKPLTFRIVSLEQENARLRTELTHARDMNAIAMADVATARRVLALEIERHNRFVASLQYTIQAMAEALTTAAEKSGNDPAPVKAVDYTDWMQPAGLPRGMR